MAYPRREIIEVEDQLLFCAVERMDVRIGAAKPDIIPQLFDVVLAPVQAQAMEQAEVGVNQISEVVQSNSASAEESSATSEELSAQAFSLNDLVGKFILRRN